jgi:hypothetical protein
MIFWEVRPMQITAQLLVMTVITLGWLALPAQACRCAPPASVPQSVQTATMVFRGKVLSIKTLQDPNGDKYRKIQFVLKQVWKGSSHPYVSVVMNMSRCNHFFEPGQEYLVYAEGDASQITPKACGRTKTWAAVDRQELRALGQGTATPWD